MWKSLHFVSDYAQLSATLYTIPSDLLRVLNISSVAYIPVVAGYLVLLLTSCFFWWNLYRLFVFLLLIASLLVLISLLLLINLLQLLTSSCCLHPYCLLTIMLRFVISRRCSSFVPIIVGVPAAVVVGTCACVRRPASVDDHSAVASNFACMHPSSCQQPFSYWCVRTICQLLTLWIGITSWQLLVPYYCQLIIVTIVIAIAVGDIHVFIGANLFACFFCQFSDVSSFLTVYKFSPNSYSYILTINATVL
jgi:hypothetical protein